MNFYLIILLLFILIGVVTAIWGGYSIKKERQRRAWPTVNGVITAANAVSEQDDLLPDIRFQYEISGEAYAGALRFPAGTTPIPGFAERYVEKYPVGGEVFVFVDPDRPENASLEMEQGGGSGLIFVIGLAMVVLGIGAILTAYSI